LKSQLDSIRGAVCPSTVTSTVPNLGVIIGIMHETPSAQETGRGVVG